MVDPIYTEMLRKAKMKLERQRKSVEETESEIKVIEGLILGVPGKGK